MSETYIFINKSILIEKIWLTKWQYYLNFFWGKLISNDMATNCVYPCAMLPSNGLMFIFYTFLWRKRMTMETLWRLVIGLPNDLHFCHKLSKSVAKCFTKKYVFLNHLNGCIYHIYNLRKSKKLLPLQIANTKYMVKL